MKPYLNKTIKDRNNLKHFKTTMLLNKHRVWDLKELEIQNFQMEND